MIRSRRPQRSAAGARLLIAGAIFIAGATAAAAPARLSAQGDQRESPEVESLRLRGVRSVSEDELSNALATRASSCRSILLEPFCLVSEAPAFEEKRYLDRLEFRRDVLRIRAFYWKHGFRETTVDTTVTSKDDGVAITFRVTEGPPTLVTAVRVLRPDSVLDDGTIRRDVLLRAGRPLDLVKLDSSLALLAASLADRGYSDAIVRDTVVVSTALAPRDTTSARDAANTRNAANAPDTVQRAAVTIRIEPRWLARVGNIFIAGNSKISERTIRNSLTLSPGEIYRRSDVLESQRQLYTSNLFSRATIQPVAAADSVKPLIVTVTEAPLREARTSAGFNTVDFVQVEGRFTNYNFFGGARRLQFRAVLGNLLAPTLNGRGIFRDITPPTPLGPDRAFLRPNYEASADLVQPWFRSARNTLGLGIFGRRRSAPGIFIDRGYGATGSFTRNLTPRAPATLAYRYERTRVEAGDVYFCVNYGVCERADIGALQRWNALSPLTLGFFGSTVDDPLNPSRGRTASLDLEHASTFTLSDYRYNRIAAQGTTYWPLGERRVLAAKLRGGWVRPLGSQVTIAAGDSSALALQSIIHPRKRFYAGGSQSVRGYGENQLGPRILTVDPTALTQPRTVNGVTYPGCTNASIADRSCNPNITGLPSSAFAPRPVGGTSVLEASVEYRFPVWGQLDGAVFVDGAFVGEGALRNITKGTGAITPGFGVRYLSPAGPIRVDLGFRPRLAELLTVVTQTTGPDGRPQIVTLDTKRYYDPLEASGWFRKVLERLTLHLSIGQAF